MPPDTNKPTIGSPPMPSRATSAFLRTVRVMLHERASDYVMWVAGHGGDAATVNTYLASLNVFPSHFDEWAHNKSRHTILASIPILSTLLPALGSTAPYRDWTPLDNHTYASLSTEPDTVPTPIPKVVETIVTLALQHHIMTKDQQNLPITGHGQRSLSGSHSPSFDALDNIFDAFGTRREDPL